MVAFTLTNIPAFMGALLSHDAFDAFVVHEITIRNGFNLIIEEGQTGSGVFSSRDSGADTAAPAGGQPVKSAAPAGGQPLKSEAPAGGQPGSQAANSEENSGRRLSYGRVRQLCFDAVKGKVLPSFMRFVLTAPSGTPERLAAASPDGFDAANVLSLAVNITYKDGTLTVTSGSSMKDIFAGKAADTAWGEEVKRLFAPFGIGE